MTLFFVVLSGTLSALSLPTAFGYGRLPDLGYLAWFSLVPLYYAVKHSKNWREACRYGFFFGLCLYGFSIYWIFIALHRYGSVPFWASLLGVGLVVFLLSLFPSVVAVISWGLARRGAPLVILFPLLWTLLEYARNYFPFGGFPWSNLAYSQHSFLVLLQVMDLTGVYGLTFLLLFGNSLLAEWFEFFRTSTRSLRNSPFCSTLILISLLGIILFYGYFRLQQVERLTKDSPQFKVSLIQGNIPQEEKWLEEMSDEIIARHLALSEIAEKQSPDLLLWPEAAYPAILSPEVTEIRDLASIKTPLVMGIVRYEGIFPEGDWPSSSDSSFQLFNSAVLLKPGGVLEDRYDKRHLVPMGEYVPLQSVFPFLEQVVESVTSFSRGREYNLIQVGAGFPRPGAGTAPLRFGITICYEDLFPEISRSFAKQGADFLVNLTNDGWYDQSSAVFQHFDFSRYRAIENRRSLVRVTNTGVTGIFSPTGEVIGSLEPFSEGILTQEVPIVKISSFYTRFGDVFLGLLSLGLIVPLPFRRRVHERIQ